MRAHSFWRLFATCRQVRRGAHTAGLYFFKEARISVGRSDLSSSCDTSPCYVCARVSAFARCGLLMASLLLIPLTSFAEGEYVSSLTAIENLLSNINRALQLNDTDDVLSYLNGIDHYWSAFDGNFGDLMDDVVDIKSTTDNIETYALQLSSKLSDVYRRLGYINDSCISIISNLDLAYAQYEAINGTLSRIAQDVGAYGDAILLAFRTLQSTVSNIDTNVDSIDETMHDLLQAILDLSVVTNYQTGVVYDFSFLTNYATRTSFSFGSSLSAGWLRGLRWSASNNNSLTTTTSSGVATFYYPYQPSLSQYLLTQTGFMSFLIREQFPQQIKSSVISALSSVSISNNVGILVGQGVTIIDKLTSIDERLDSIDLNVVEIIDKQEKISTHIESIDNAAAWITNHLSSATNNTHLLQKIVDHTKITATNTTDILALLVAYTNVVLTGYEDEKTKIEDEIAKDTDSVASEVEGVEKEFDVSFLDPSSYEQVGMGALENSFPSSPPSVYDFNIQIPRYSFGNEEIMRESTLEATPADIEKVIHFFGILRQLFSILAWVFGWYVLHLHFRFFMWVVDKYLSSINQVPKE